MKTLILAFGLVFSLILPIGLLIYWKKSHNLKLSPFLIGVFGFMFFALFLEQIPLSLLITSSSPFFVNIRNNPLLFGFIGALMAGLFEETGRLFCFKCMLNNNKDKNSSVAYGIGHGGIEVIITLSITYLTYLLFDLGINMVNEAYVATFNSIIESINLSVVLLALFERVSAIILHIALSILVFKAANFKNSFYLYPLAILFHTLVNMNAVFYKAQYFNLIITEISIFMMSIIIFIFARNIYKKLD